MNESVRRSLLEVLRRATDDNPAARYASVVEFWSDLAQDTTIIRPRLNVAPGAMPSGPEQPDFDPALASAPQQIRVTTATLIEKPRTGGSPNMKEASPAKTSDGHAIGVRSGPVPLPSTLPASVKAEKSAATFSLSYRGWTLLAGSFVALLLLQVPNFVEQYTLTLDTRISRIHAFLARFEASEQSYKEGERKKQEDQANRIIEETMELINGYMKRYADYDSEMTVLLQVSDTITTMTTNRRFIDYMNAFGKAANMISDADHGLKPLKSALLTSKKSLDYTIGMMMSIAMIEWKLSDSDYYTLVSLMPDVESDPHYYLRVKGRGSDALRSAREFAHTHYVEHKTALARAGPLGRVGVFLDANLSSVTNETLRTYRPKLLPNRLDELLWALVGFLIVWGLAKMR